MNGPQHFAAAEAKMKEATEVPAGEYAALVLAQAQVHATLALAAATIAQSERYLVGGEGQPTGKIMLLDPVGAQWAEVLK